jgi:Tol biopolymer transport system component
MSLSADSSTLAAVYIKRNTHLWVVPANEPHLARKATFGAGGYRSQLRWIPSGRIVFDSDMAGTPDISVMNEDGSAQRQLLGELTGRAIAVGPAVSPDEKYIFFGFDLNERRHVWRMGIDGANPVQISNGVGEDHPHCSPDGAWVVYTDIGSLRPTLWRMPAAGGQPVQITSSFSKHASFSPDGKLIACLLSESESEARWRIGVIEAGTGERVRIFPQTVYSGYSPKWTPDGRGLTYTDGRQLNVWLQPVEGGIPRKLTEFTNDHIFGYEWSPDGKRLACIRGIWERDLVVIKNLRLPGGE